MRTNFPVENEINVVSDTVLTQETPESVAESDRDVKFPKRVKFRGKVLTSIYRRRLARARREHHSNTRAWRQASGVDAQRRFDTGKL